MIKKQPLIVLILLFVGYFGFGQIAAWDFTGENTVVTSAAEIYNVNLDASNLLTRGTGATASAGANSFRTVGFQNNGISTSNTDYFQFTLSASTGYTLSLSTIDARFNGTATFATSPGVSSQFAYSLDGTNFTLIGTAQTTIGAPVTLTQVNLFGIAALQNIPASTTVTFRYYASGQTTTGGWGFFSAASGIYGLSIGGNVISLSAPELQLTDDTVTNQNCGYIIYFGSQALSNNTDKTFSIKNIGSVDLDVTSFNITGDYTIVSPSTPFTVTSGSSTTVTVRFTPTVNGTRTSVLTINNNDGDEGSCTVNLTGVGYTPAPEINVEGNLGTFPDITNGDNTPSGTDNTLYAAQFIGASQSKSYRINNEGTANLTLSGISIIGTNPGDFSVSISPSNTITPSAYSILEITFSPTASGTRSAIVSIANNDSDENPFEFTIQGTGNCVSSSLAITPSSGPVGTTITVTGTNFGASTTTSLSGITATHSVLSSTTMAVVVPNNATTGNLVVVNDSGCTSSVLFNIIDETVGGCEGGSNLSDLIISEVTDATTGGVSYIEIYNGTGGNVQLNNYSLEVYSNGNSTPSGTISPLGPGNLPNNSTYVIAIGVAGTPDASNTCSITGGNGELADLTSGIGGINKKDDEHDAIRLLKSSGTVVVDQFGVYLDKTWMDATSITGDRGFNFRRLITASPLPNPNFNINDWNMIDWAGSGQSSCSTNDYSDIVFYDFSTASSPSITTQPMASSSTCGLTATLTVEATEGFAGSNPLAYQWYYSAPGDSGWTAVPNILPYSGETTSILDISNTQGLNNYQYYCQVRENDVTCYKATNVVKLDVYATTWNGSSWSNGAPNIGTIATLNGNYTTNMTNGSFSACNLIVNNGYTLNITDTYYVEVENDLTVNGNVIVQPTGSFVQNNDLGMVDGAVLSDKTKIVVNKKTASPSNAWYEYTYWSSPVVGEIIADGLYESSTNRRFLFNAQNYLDHCSETNNNNICDDNGGAGLQDGIDDNGDDWQWVNGATVMQPGVGYASTHDSTIFGSTPGCPGSSCSIEYTFEGPFNNGEIKVLVYRNDLEMNDTNSNFIGNPYPSAIDVDEFFDMNAYDVSLNPTGALEGVVYLWSQNTLPSATANGNQNLNFSDLDYAMINAGTGGAAGGDGVIPNGYIPSGQGFFVNYSNSGAVVSTNGTIKTSEVVFNNAMRAKGASDNAQFFRTTNPNPSKSKGNYNKLWINLTSDIGVTNQVLVGYVSGATNGNDGLYYDVPRGFKPKTALALYSLSYDGESKYAIQGKDLNSLNLEEVIPLGFYTAINGATLYKFSLAQFKGDFFNANTVYLKDKLMNVVYDLSQSDYSFTSVVGEFKDRFEIVFKSETLSDIELQQNAKKLSIIELGDGRIQFKSNTNLTIQSIKIIDILGRTLYQLKGSSSSQIYDLSNLSQATYIAKIELSNGQVITKRAVKRI